MFNSHSLLKESNSQSEQSSATTIEVGVAVPATSQNKPRRPLGISIICVLMFLDSVFNFFQGSAAAADDISLIAGGFNTQTAIGAWASWAIPADAVVNSLTIGLSILGFLIVYGFLYRKKWSYKTFFTYVILAILSSVSTLLLMLTAPVVSDISTLALSLIFLVIYFIIVGSYLQRTYVKEWLNVTLPIQSQVQ